MGAIMIRCPQTGREIPTGIEMDTSEFQRAPVFFSRVQCPVCDRVHEWFAKDAWVATAQMRNPPGTHSSIGCEVPRKISAPDGFCRGEGGTPPGAGTTT